MTYVFGVFEFDSTTTELKKSGRTVALEPQPARALGLLLERAGETVTREELTAHVWGADTHIGDEAARLIESGVQQHVLRDGPNP